MQTSMDSAPNPSLRSYVEEHPDVGQHLLQPLLDDPHIALPLGPGVAQETWKRSLGTSGSEIGWSSYMRRRARAASPSSLLRVLSLDTSTPNVGTEKISVAKALIV